MSNFLTNLIQTTGDIAGGILSGGGNPLNLLGLPDKGTGNPTVVANNNYSMASSALSLLTGNGLPNISNVLKPITAPIPATTQGAITPAPGTATNPLVWLLVAGVGLIFILKRK